MSQEIIDEKVLELIDRLLLEHPDIGYVSLEGRIRLRKELFNAVRRMDVLSDLLEDDSITEIMINGYDQMDVFSPFPRALRAKIVWHRLFSRS